MNIQLDEDTMLRADKNQWIIAKKVIVKKDGVKIIEWRGETFHISLEQAINSYAERTLRTSEASTLVEALEECKRIATSLTAALSPKYIVTEA